MHQTFPDLGASRLGIPNSQRPNVQTANQQTLNSAAALNAMTEQPRREHARVVQDQEIAATEVRRQLIEHRVLRRLRRAIEHNETRATALGGRMVSNQLLGQFEVELVDVHDPKKRARLVRPRLASSPFHRSPTLAIR